MTTTHADVVADKDPSERLGARRREITPDTKMGPATHLAAERERLAGLTWEHFDARPLAATLGAELTGIDLTEELSDEAVAEIRQALYDYKVIFFRDQPLTPDQHVAFAGRFGELEIHPFIPGNPGRPELVHFEKSAEVGGYENLWHHDVTWRDRPSMGAVLHAIEVPAVGGDTLFSDMYAAYDSLDDDTRALVDTLTARHDFMKAFGHNVPDDRRAEMRATYPVVEHPVTLTHQGTGRKLLYVNRVFTDSIVGMDPDEGAALLERLYREAETVEHQVRFHWEADSVAFWDNRAVQHYAASDYWPQRRVMERASIQGDRPAA
jgi:alpha-ketoglutarate-dependent taurine dioxygenase